MKGCTLPPRESVNTKFLQGTSVAPINPPTPNKYVLNTSLNVGEPTLLMMNTFTDPQFATHSSNQSIAPATRPWATSCKVRIFYHMRASHLARIALQRSTPMRTVPAGRSAA